MMYGLAIALTACLVVVNALVVPEPLIRGNKRGLSGSDLTCFHSDDVVDLNFDNSEILINNLDGKGPVAGPHPVMHFADVGEYGGQTIDLVISVKPGSTYDAKNINANGFGSLEKTGQINLKGDTETIFKYTFYEGGTYPTNPIEMELPAFKISIFDIDLSKKVTEEYEVEGWEYALYDEDTNEIEVSDCSGGSPVNCLNAKSKGIGKGCDNPIDPMDLSTNYTCKDNTVNQFARSFQVEFKDKSSFEIFFKVDVVKPANNEKGRKFIWAFDSAWTANCTDYHFECTW